MSDEEKTETEESSEEEKVNSITTTGRFTELHGCKVYDLLNASGSRQLNPDDHNYQVKSITEKEYYYLNYFESYYKYDTEPTAYDVYNVFQCEENKYDLGYLIGDGVQIYGGTLEKNDDCVQELTEKDGHQVVKETGTFKARDKDDYDTFKEIPYVFCYTTSEYPSNGDNPYDISLGCWGCYTIDPDEQTLKEMDELVQYALDNVEWGIE